MATPALIVVITIALVSVAALTLAVVVLLGQLKRLTATVADLQIRLEPALDRLSRDAEVTQRELERISAAAARLQDREHAGVHSGDHGVDRSR